MIHTLFCTLGTEAQVVTVTLQQLLKLGFPIQTVAVIHTDPTVEPSRSSLLRIRETMPARFPDVRLASVEVRADGDGHSLADTATETDVRSGFISMYRAILAAKQAGETVHLCIAGGRKVMGVYGMTVAQLLFEPTDRLWYLVTVGKLLDERRMLARPDDEVTLINVPFVRASGVPPDLTEIGQFLDPEEAVATLNTRQDRAHRAKLTLFIKEACTQAERVVLRTTVTHPDWTYGQIHHHLGKSYKTLDAQLQSIYDKARTFFEIDTFTRQTLNRLYATYTFEEKDRG